MSQILSEEQLFGRIYYYLTQLEIWKVRYPILETFREELPPNIPLFTLSVQGGYKKHFRDVVYYLDTYVINSKLIAEEYMANIVYTIFDQLDIALSKKGDSELLLLFEKRFYVNCQRHWKDPNNLEDDPNPISSSKKSFETIGLCDFDESCKLVNVTKTTNRDVLTKKTELRVGLFSLTENFSNHLGIYKNFKRKQKHSRFCVARYRK